MTAHQLRLLVLHTAFSVCFILSTVSARASENACSPVAVSEESISKLQRENDGLARRILELESVKAIPVAQLRHKKIQRLKEIAAAVKLQRQSASDFEGFVNWMSANLAGYSRYIQAGSYAAVAARVLPIPYAGQASVFTKFVAQFTLALNSASVSVANYLNSSQKFIVMADAIDPARLFDEKATTEASLFAEQRLLKDMNDAQLKLATVSDLSAGALSFLESLNHYASGTDEYWNKAKGVFRKDIDPKEKSFISESAGTLKTQADRFNSKLKTFDEVGKKQAIAVRTLAVFDELAVEATFLK
jgi:hypothetical protein